MKRLGKYKRSLAGYTMIEVVMSMGVLTLGAMGLAGMQHAVATANTEARKTTTAAVVARLWADRIRRDSLRWTTGGLGIASANIANTRYLAATPADGSFGPWFTPVPPSGSGESYAFDHYGNDTSNGTGNANYVEFCAQTRTRWIFPGQAMRAEIRVWWHRPSRRQNSALSDRRISQNCGIGQEADMGNDRRMRFLTTNLVLRRNPIE